MTHFVCWRWNLLFREKTSKVSFAGKCWRVSRPPWQPKAFAQGTANIMKAGSKALPTVFALCIIPVNFPASLKSTS
jgi:hypothetical protein